MSYYKVVMYDELTHHGIKGQEWGKRNGPPYPLDYEAHTAKQKRLNNKVVIDPDAKKPKTVKKKYYDNFIKEGYSDEEAKKYAKEFQNRKRALMVAGGCIAAAGGAYILMRYANANKSGISGDDDRTFKAGDILKRTSEHDTLLDNFYVATNDRDAADYVANWGGDANHGFKKQLEIEVNKEIKVAGNKNAEKMFRDWSRKPEIANLLKDAGFSEGYGEFIRWAPIGARPNSIFIFSDDKEKSDKLFNDYSDFLKSKGYGGVVDKNDNRRNGGLGYDSLYPVIFFGGKDTNNFSIKKVNQIDQKMINEAKRQVKNRKDAMFGMKVEDAYAIWATETAAAFAALGILSNSKSAAVNRAKADKAKAGSTSKNTKK